MTITVIKRTVLSVAAGALLLRRVKVRAIGWPVKSIVAFIVSLPLIILKVYDPATAFWNVTYPEEFVTSVKEVIPGWTIEDTSVLFNGLLLMSWMHNCIVPWFTLLVGVGVGAAFGVTDI